MTISAKVILDSSCMGSRITTMELKYPRFIHAEFMTHRVFSRNASSSRAIPVVKQIEMIMEDTAMPIHWGKNQAGMQAREENDAKVVIQTLDSAGILEQYLSKEEAWLAARDQAVKIAKAFNEAGYHKQIVNRLLEPFSHITVLVTSTQWANFFALRNHPDAQPEIRELAILMKAAMAASSAVILDQDDWHMPYITEEDVSDVYHKCKERRITRDEPKKSEITEMLCAISAARCARVSYLTHDRKRPTIDEDLDLFRRLAYAEPPHMSPCEHQATYCQLNDEGNYRNWTQFRHKIRGNTVHD
ncbi:MAG: FAD-dependent thymidylate synthase [Bacteroides thetaiotaomicron]